MIARAWIHDHLSQVCEPIATTGRHHSPEAALATLRGELSQVIDRSDMSLIRSLPLGVGRIPDFDGAGYDLVLLVEIDG